MAALLIGTVLLMATCAANAQTGSSVSITSVDNYAGNSNVHTDKPNTTITVTELDADKKPVRSWTGTTDEKGKITIPAGSNLSAPYLRAKVADPKMADIVVPTDVVQKEPFMFSAGGTVSGTVVDIKTVEGEVVASQKPDKNGRVFLAAGLAAGTYLITAGDGRTNKIGSVKVSNQVFDPFECAKQGLSLDPDPVAIDVTKFGTVAGNFPNPGALDLDDFVSTRTPTLRAASTSQLVFDKPSDSGIKPGFQGLKVRDTQTGQTAATGIVFYEATAKLSQVKVQSGSETHLIVSVSPKELGGTVNATILNGPVTFSNGSDTMAVPTAEGLADFRLQAKPGSTGKFDVNWEFSPKEIVKKVWDPLKKIWDPVKQGLKTEVWDPLKKLIKKFLDTPPTGGAGKGADEKKDPPKGDPPKVDEKKPDPPKGGGGDTKATDDGWTRFKDDDGRTGRMEIKDDGKGYKRVVKIYDDTGMTITTTRTGQKRMTVTTNSTTKAGAPRIEVEEVLEHKKDANGEWVAESGEKKTWEFDGKEKKLIKTEKWDKKSKGWK